MAAMTAAGSLLLLAALAFHLGALRLFILGAGWLGRRRRLGYPDSPAQLIDRRSILVAIAAGWIWTNVFVLTVVAIASGRI